VKYLVVWSYGSCQRGDRGGGWVDFDSLEEAQKWIIRSKEIHFEMEYIIIHGEKIDEKT
jgi:hypothetical protein